MKERRRSPSIIIYYEGLKNSIMSIKKFQLGTSRKVLS